MIGQIDLFDFGKTNLTIDKPIRLIELFAGYGSQALALKYLGIPFEHWKISEWAIKSIQAYKDMHFDDDHDYSLGVDIKEIREFLSWRISRDYNTPLTDEDVEKMSEKECRTIFSNMMCSNNIGSIVSAKAEDLEISGTDRYLYIMTYSFPCQDLSNAGLGAGMSKGSGTRSGLLWEVERLLDECKELPQILLMENVPAVCGQKNIDDFRDWILFLQSKGYTNDYKILNAKDYGVPQNRERCFMISYLGEYYYDFPEPQKLEKKLKDVLEDDVDESYYLSDERVAYFMKHSAEMEQKGNGFRFDPAERERERRQSQREPDAEWMITSSLKKLGNCNPSGNGISGKVFDADYLCPTITTDGETKVML